MAVWSRLVSLALAIFLMSVDASAWADCNAGWGAIRSEHLEQALRELLPCAEAGDPRAQFMIGVMYDLGKGTSENNTEAVRWYRRAAEQGFAGAQYYLGEKLRLGDGVVQDYMEAVRWLRAAAEQGDAGAQTELGTMYYSGSGVVQDDAEAARWLRSAAEQGIPKAQSYLGAMYTVGQGVPQDELQAYVWLNLAAAQFSQGELATATVALRDEVAAGLSPSERARGQELARNWRPTPATNSTGQPTDQPQKGARLLTDEEFLGSQQRRLDLSGSGFVVGEAGQIVTNHHVVAGCAEVRVQAPGEEVTSAVVIARDQINDLALLRAPVRLTPAVLRDGGGIRPGETVVAVGFPLHGLLASEANVTTGTVSALAGIGNDARFLQMTVPVQPGNSGGPLLDLEGRVVGVVVGKLDALKVASVTGDIPQNVNFAIKAEVVRSFLKASGVVPGAAHGWWEDSPLADGPAAVGAEGKAFTVLVECWK
jgi:uncharacterized protein